MTDNLSATGDDANSFAEDTADKLGVDAHMMQRQVQIAKGLIPEVQEIIEQSGKKFTQQDLIKLSRMGRDSRKKKKTA